MVEEKNNTTTLTAKDAGGTSVRTFHVTGVAEHWRSQGVEELVVRESAEPIVMDTDRQKLELDITEEFEFADGEAIRLIDEAG